MRDESPHTPIYVSCTTVAGRAVAESKLADMTDGIFYAPIDTCWAVRRVLRRIRPSVLVVLETEIWPNLYREVKRGGASVVVVNGRIGDKAAKAYQRFRWFFSAVFKHVDIILAQSAQDERRYLAAGAYPRSVRVAGNLKYDFQPNPIGAPAMCSPCSDGRYGSPRAQRVRCALAISTRMITSWQHSKSCTLSIPVFSC